MLTRLDRDSPKRLAVVGDTMLDCWRPASLKACQDGCPAVLAGLPEETPGGAAGAARQLDRWSSTASLLGPINFELQTALAQTRVRTDIALLLPLVARMPVKERFVGDDGRILFRVDHEDANYGVKPSVLNDLREWAMKTLRATPFDGVLLVDYGKGFLDDILIRLVIKHCKERQIPVVADPKRPPDCFKGAVLKVNMAYTLRYTHDLPVATTVTTCGELPPIAGDQGFPRCTPVLCRNHVGAGDCFGMHLLLALTHGCSLHDASRFAHAAARVYVQHDRGRPPWPHEVLRDLDPLGGKRLAEEDVPALKQSLAGRRVVFTNGVFRVPHAGHAWLLDWARQQGDVLVVGINDDDSARALRNGQKVLPLDERVGILSGLGAVDWIIPFKNADPCAIMSALGPDLLVKGSDYAGELVPGHDVAKEVRFAPPSPYPAHSTDLVAALQAAE